MTINLATLEQTCGGCPSAWEAQSTNGNDVYIQARHGYLSVDLNGDEIYGTTAQELGMDWDGVISTDEMQDILTLHAQITFQ